MVFDNVVVEQNKILLVSETKASVNGVEFRLSHQQGRFFSNGEAVTFVGDRAEELGLKGQRITRKEVKTSVQPVKIRLK